MDLNKVPFLRKVALEFIAGTAIEDAAKIAMSMAVKCQCPVWIKFNDVAVCADPSEIDLTGETLADEWFQKYQKKTKQHA